MDKNPVEYPEYVRRGDVAIALHCSPRTISRLMNIEQRVGTERIRFKKLVKALGCEPQFLLDCLSGRDQGIPMHEAACLLGMNEHQLVMRKKRRAVLPHVAMLPRGVRFSRNAVFRMMSDKFSHQPMQNETQPIPA